MCFFCFHKVCSQEKNGKIDFDTIYIYKGTWSNVDGLPYYPDDNIYLTIKPQHDVLFQENTIGLNRMTVFFTVDYIVDSSDIIFFYPNTLNVYGIRSIEDSNENLIYFWNPPDTEEYDSLKFDHSCISELYDFLHSFVLEAKISGKAHGYDKGKKGSYTFGLLISPNNIKCFRTIF